MNDEQVTIEYEIVNHGDRPIVAFNRVPSTDSPNPEPGEPENFYVEPSGTGAVLSKQVFRTPEGVSVYARQVLRGTIVEAGERISEHIITGSTYETRRPYQELLGYDQETVQAEFVDVCIGVALAANVTALSKDAHPIYPHDTRTANQQHMYCSSPGSS
ncbi:hypothetical protein ABN034_29205 [Actinopolymorpha sp. B11F2]